MLRLNVKKCSLFIDLCTENDIQLYSTFLKSRPDVMETEAIQIVSSLCEEFKYTLWMHFLKIIYILYILNKWISMYTITRTHTHTYWHSNTHTHMHSRTHTCTHVHTHAQTHTHIYTHTQTYIHTHTHTYTHAHTHSYIQIYINN